jgi:hypothetical protein
MEVINTRSAAKPVFNSTDTSRNVCAESFGNTFTVKGVEEINCRLWKFRRARKQGGVKLLQESESRLLHY